jgi:hypothetical protein
MSLVTVNDVGIIRGTITMPLVGVWAAELVIDQLDGTGFDAGTSVTIKGDSIQLSGTVVPDRTGSFLDAVHVRVLGGKAGMSKTSTPRSYVQPGAFVKDVLNGITTDSGESLSSSVSQSFLNTNLTAWSTLNQTINWNLRALLKWLGPDFSWRILDDGTLWMGAESWPQASGTIDIMSQRPSEGTFTLGCESPFILPGTSLDGVGNVARVEHQIDHNRIRSFVSIDLAEGDRGISGAIARMVAANTAGFDYYALYQCKVVSQSADLSTVDISFDAPNKNKLAGLQRVPVRNASGIAIQFQQNATVLLGWDGGNPQAPYVSLGLSSDSPTLIKLNGGNLKNARVTDPLAVGTLTGQAGPYPVVFTYVPTQNVGGVDTPGAPSSGPSVNLAGIVSNGGGATGVKS